MNKGKIVQIIGPVVDVEFPDKLPHIYNALKVEFSVEGKKNTLTLEVQQHLGGKWVRTVAMSGVEGLKRGYEVIDTGESISMPVGDCVLGRIFNVTGDLVDEGKEIKPENSQPEKTTEKKDEPAKQEKNEDTKPQVQAQETRDAVLYFISVDNSGTLVREKIIRQVKKTDSPLTIAINSLLTGPTSVENQKGIISLIPSGTKLLSATVKNGTAVLNFNESFQFNTKGIEGCRGQLMQIVYTATEFSTVDNVQFLIEGQRKEFLGTEGIRIGYPLSRSSFN